MTDRERWIVYPLLFMALGYGWKANVMPPEEVNCQKLSCGQAEFGIAQAHKFKSTFAEFGAASAGQIAVRENGFTELELLATDRGGMIHLHRYLREGSPVTIHARDETGRYHMIGGLFRHPPKVAPKAEPEKNEKPSAEDASGKKIAPAQLPASAK